MSMKPLVGWGLGGPTFTPRDLPNGSARIGEPTWSPSQLLRDLEMRVGLWPATESASARVPRFVARIKAVADANAFYAKSFAADEIGTATTLLAWRDALVDAGWNGMPIANAGARLDAITAIENAQTDEPLPLGNVDRLARVERELDRLTAPAPGSPYETLTLVEPRASWSTRWQRVFAQLERLGTRIDAFAVDLPAAPANTDLGLLQSLLRGDTQRAPIKGDGSLVVVRGDTLGDLAELTACFLASNARTDAVVVRALDPAPLESALRRHGLATQGHDGSSAWRPLMQVLPLAVELAYAPRDPYRVLELLTLPHGPFRGMLGARLARAVARQPGIDGEEWRRQKEDVAKRLRDRELAAGKTEDEADAYVAERLARVAEWIEAPGAGPAGAPRETLLAVAERVKTWLQKRIPLDRALYGPAHAQAAAFLEALRHDERALIAKEDARHMLDRLARSAHAHALFVEEAGRIPHVSHPSALLASTSTVVVWGFVGGTERAVPRQPWTKEEREALAAAGVVLPDATEHLRIEADAWRRVIHAARERVVLVVPSSVQGEAKSSHPLWDEIAARLDLDEVATARITHHATAILEGRDAFVATAPTTRVPLPEGRGEWMLPPDVLAATSEHRKATGTSATSLEKLASCPLAWVLDQRAALRSGAISKVANGPLLFGSLTHRLVEELHREAAFDLTEEPFIERARAAFDSLLEREGATLLLHGASFERHQLTRQVLHAMRELHRYLGKSGFRIAAVEEVIETDSAIGTLKGRLDVRLVDADGRSAVLDLKWGASTYRELLEEGRAVQLAIYARAVTSSTKRSSMAPAAYFALAAGQILAADARMKAPRQLDGPTLDSTLERVEATVGSVLASHGRGKIYVAATKKSLPLLEALGVPKEKREAHFEAPAAKACSFCDYDGICGRRWEVLA